MSVLGALADTYRLLLDPARPVWPDATIRAFDAQVDARRVQEMLPPGLLAEPAVTVFVADYPRTSFGVAYRECGLLLHAQHRGRPVLHCAWMVVDDDAALILGRDLLGFPKKLARIELSDERAVVERRGVRLLELTLRERHRSTDATPFPRPIVNVKGQPGLAPATLWRMDVPQRVHAGHEVTFDVQLRSGRHDPLDAFDLGSATLRGRVWRCDLGVPPAGGGRIPRGVVPVGLVPPGWLVARLPTRCL